MQQLPEFQDGGTKNRDTQKLRVERLAQIGATEEDIAVELQIPLHRLQKRFHRELQRGVVAGKHHILETLFDHAHSGSNMAATALWVKAKCGWRDTGSSSNSPAIQLSILEVVTGATRPSGQ